MCSKVHVLVEHERVFLCAQESAHADGASDADEGDQDADEGDQDADEGDQDADEGNLDEGGQDADEGGQDADEGDPGDEGGHADSLGIAASALHGQASGARRTGLTTDVGRERFVRRPLCFSRLLLLLCSGTGSVGLSWCA